jgi:multiple sugar transport system permease protein
MWGDDLAPALLLDIDHTTLSVAITQSYRDPHEDYIPTVQAAAAARNVVR